MEQISSITYFSGKQWGSLYNIREKLKILKNIVASASKSGYITEQILSIYLKAQFKREQQLFIIDSCTVHKSPQVSDVIDKSGAKTILIPGGLHKISPASRCNYNV